MNRNCSDASMSASSLCDMSSVPDGEQQRLQMLEDLNLLDSPVSESFDRITRLASQCLGVPVAVVSLTDRSRQWFKSHHGVDLQEIPREGAPCAEVTRSQALLHVPNLLEDARFADSPLARAGVRFYAGAPLTNRQGCTMGAMCVLGNEPRSLSDGQLRSLEDLAAMVMAQIELQHEYGRVDSSSGLPNRYQLQDDLEDQNRAFPGASRVLLVIELAEPRHVTEAISVLGTSYLDDLVQSSAGRVKAVLRNGQILYHVGFGCFALVLSDALDPWHEVVDSLAEQLRGSTEAAGQPVTITAAIGVLPFQLGEMSSSEILRTTMSAVHDARQEDLLYALYSAANHASYQRRFLLLKYLRESLETGSHFHLVFQPRISLASGRCEGAEALLRWSHPELGNVPPGEFIPLIEQTSLARPLTQWVLTSALRQLRTWKDAGLTLRVSVNVSARNLEEPDFAEQVGSLLASSGMEAGDIELEFTESALIRHQKRVLDQLFRLRAMGIELAIDDFGTGYSSFSYIRQIPANVVKLDQSFIRKLAEDETSQVLVRAMISMIHDLGHRCVAEGVETRAILELLKAMGCDEVQGYLIARPLSVPDLERFLHQRAASQRMLLVQTLGPSTLVVHGD